MEYKRYEDMDVMALDVIREVGSIGTGSAATALSGLLNLQIKMTTPDADILGYNEAVSSLGDAEDIVAAVLVEMSGEMHGIMLFLLKLDFINEVLGSMMGEKVEDFSQLGEMEFSALTEVGNIMISTYVGALSKLAEVKIHLSVPAVALNMLGGILTVPMTEFGYETEKMLMIRGKFIINGKKLDSNLLMLPDIESLNYLIKKLVSTDD